MIVTKLYKNSRMSFSPTTVDGVRARLLILLAVVVVAAKLLCLQVRVQGRGQVIRQTRPEGAVDNMGRVDHKGRVDNKGKVDDIGTDRTTDLQQTAWVE